jgi:hypothetical protein
MPLLVSSQWNSNKHITAQLTSEKQGWRGNTGREVRQVLGSSGPYEVQYRVRLVQEKG